MDSKTWNDTILSFPKPHFLQSWQWGQVKKVNDWTPHHLEWKNDQGDLEAAALVLERSVRPLPFLPAFKMLYAPKGPLLKDWSDPEMRKRTLESLIAYAQEQQAFMIKIDPDVLLGTGIPGEDGVEDPAGTAVEEFLNGSGWQYAHQQIQFKNTAVIDLKPTEEEIMAAMKQKTRYNIRLAGRKGVQVRTGTAEDFHALYKLYAETSLRGGFVIRSEDYYQHVWQSFLDADLLTPLIAEVEGEISAGLMLFHYGPAAYYFYGMSGSKHRKLMPTYALQWEAIKRSKARGCTKYDLWGAPDTFTPDDPMWGVFRIKAGLGGKAVQTIGAFDFVIKPLPYWLYTTILPKVLNFMRRRGNESTRENLTGED